MVTSFGLSAAVGVWTGVWTAVRSGSFGAGLVSVLSVVGYSIPGFWLGQVLILLFGVALGWFPIVGMTSRFGISGPEMWLDVAWHLVLPTATLTAFFIALISRLTRASMLEILDQEYIRAARGKGLSEPAIIYRHALPNALIPVVTILGLQLGTLIAGFVLVETVFSWPGLGRLTFDAIAARDYPVISGLFLFISVSVIAANLLTDLVYAFIDPRIRYG
jgi:peptide/nickel transport system permease protein